MPWANDLFQNLLAENKNVLNHRVMKRITSVKWTCVVFAVLKEMGAYLGLLLSYYVTVIFADPDWIQFMRSSDYAVMVHGSAVCMWLCVSNAASFAAATTSNCSGIGST